MLAIHVRYPHNIALFSRSNQEGRSMRWVVGLLLVCAEVLKSVLFVTEPASTLAIPLGRWLLRMQIDVEVGVGLLGRAGIR